MVSRFWFTEVNRGPGVNLTFSVSTLGLHLSQLTLISLLAPAWEEYPAVSMGCARLTLQLRRGSAPRVPRPMMSRAAHAPDG